MNPEDQRPVSPTPPAPLSPQPYPVQSNLVPPSNDQRLQDSNFPLKVMQPGERVICRIKPHPFGLLFPTLTAGIVLLFLVGAAAYAPHVVTSLSQQYRTALFLIVSLLAVLDILFFWIATVIYGGNQWIVTSDSITQLSQTGLFFKRTSQMSFENLEDVSFSQKGLIPELIDFGALSVETAGNHSKFVFRYCPQPQKYATMIIAAHEDFMRHQENPTALIDQSLQQMHQ